MRSFLAQILTSGSLAAVSDVVCQLVVEEKERYDPWRTVRLASVTAAVVAPVQFHWFRLLNDRFRGSSLRVGLKRMLADQVLAAPILTPLFVFCLKWWELKFTEVAMTRTRELTPTILLTNYKVWPLVQTLNMTIVPLHLRVVFVQFVAAFWNMYISHTINKPPHRT